MLAGGTVDALPYKKTGEFRVLGIANEQPDWSMPDVPTMRSQGYDVIAVSETGVVAPVVLLPGNHDSIIPQCLFQRAGIIGLPDIHVLGVTNAGSILFEQHGLEIWGHAHRGYGDMTPLHTPRPRTTRWQIAVAHGHYVPPDEWHREAHRGWKISDHDIAATEAHYVALGHWDRPVQAGDGRVPAYYSGSPDLARTVNAIRLSAATGVTVDRVPLIWV